MPRKYRHFIYELYLALADANGVNGLNMTEAEGRQRIKQFLPNFADFVDPIIEAGGDLAKLPAATLSHTDNVIDREALQLNGNDVMDQRIRDGLGRLARPTEGQNENDGDSSDHGNPAPQDMNSVLRNAINRRVIQVSR